MTIKNVLLFDYLYFISEDGEEVKCSDIKDSCNYSVSFNIWNSYDVESSNINETIWDLCWPWRWPNFNRRICLKRWSKNSIALRVPAKVIRKVKINVKKNSA